MSQESQEVLWKKKKKMRAAFEQVALSDFNFEHFLQSYSDFSKKPFLNIQKFLASL
jgi:hypothetical protein